MELIRLQSKVKNLLNKIFTIEQRIENREQELHGVVNSFEEKYPDLMRSLFDLTNNIVQLEALKNSLLNKPVEPSNDTESFTSKTTSSFKEEEKGCKSIFNKIARECHPDVNDGSDEKTKIFLKAKEFLTNVNFTGLMKLLDSLTLLTDIDELLGESEIESLENSLKEKEKALRVLNASFAAKLLSYQKSSQGGKADVLFCSLMVDEMNIKTKELEKLKQIVKKLEERNGKN